MKKRPRSLQPAAGRMQRRALEARALQPEEQAAFFYCAVTEWDTFYGTTR